MNNLKSISREEDGNTGELFVYDYANQLSSVSYKADVTPHAPGGAPGGTIAGVEEDEDRDALGRPTQTLFPDGTTEETTYELGQLKTYKTRRGQKKIVDVYDERGREKHHYWRTPQDLVDLQTPAISQLWDDAGRLTKIWNSFSIIDYSYDEAGGLRSEGTTVTGTGLNELHYCRYPTGEVSKITYPNGTQVSRSYTARGQLKDVGWQAGATSYVYWPDGRVNVQVRTNGVKTSYGYDERGMISSVQHRLGDDVTGHDLARRDYWRDNRDRIVAWKRGTDQTYNGMEDGRGNRYGYDEEGQLTGASYRALNPETGTPSGALRTDSFSYDALGNRQGQNHVANRGQLMTMVRRDNGLNQYISWSNDPEHPVPDPQHWGSAIYHDDNMPMPSPTPTPPVGGNGVTTADGSITASYNALNQPVGMWVSTYGSNYLWFGYDPLGRCVKRWKGPASAGTAGYNPATYFYYDGANLVQEGSGAGNVERVYVHGGRVDEIVASNVNGLWYNHHYDAQGNCILLSNASGALSEQYDYDAFGYPYFYTASGTKLGAANLHTRFLFTGREWISDMKIYDYRARMYQPELGRFLQPDPQEFAAGDYNLYRYCHNDPVNKSDPTGLRDQAVGEAHRDIMWDMARYMDSSNTEQGSFAAFTDRAYMGAVGDGAGGGNDRRYTMAQVSQVGAQNRGDEATIDKSRRILAQQTKEGEDSTGAIVDGKPVPGDRIRGKQVPYRFGKPVYARSGNSVLAARKIDHMEEPPVPSRSDALSHYHSRTGFTSQGRSVADPTNYDMDALTTTRFMLFSNPYLKAQGAYRIYRDGVPGYVTRHDLYDP